MYKTLCVAVLLLPTFALAQASKPASPGAFNSPQIVAKGKFPNQTAAIPTTTIFTHTQTGLYRLNVYATLTKVDPNSGAYWYYSLAWTDDAGAQGAPFPLLFQYGNTLGPFVYENTFMVAGVTLPYEAKAGTPITHSMMQVGIPDSSSYSFYYTLERLE